MRKIGRSADDVQRIGRSVQIFPAREPALMQRIGKGSRNERANVLLQTMLKELGYLTSIDGSFGAGTERAVQRFQRDKGLVVDGIVGEKTWTTLISLVPNVFASMASKWLGEDDLDRAAEALGIERPVLRAVYQVESRGSGFLGLQPKILFEGHVFWRELQARGIQPQTHRRGNEDILYPQWTSEYYRGGMGEYDRLARAAKIDEEAALRSASWGLFQIMGNNAQWLGYANVRQFVDKMYLHEREHLAAFCAYVKQAKMDGKPLVEFLRMRNWAAFAKGYNGPAYRQNHYDEKLAEAYARLQV